jgi:hypothetical protein
MFKVFGKAGRAGNGEFIAKRRNAAKSLERRALRETADRAATTLRPLPIDSLLPAEYAL